MVYKKITIYFSLVIALSCAFSCGFKRVTKTSNIAYGTKNLSKQELNVFSPKNSINSNPVLIFIHGGNWNSGNKSLYSFLGKRFAKKGVVTVVIGYPYSPEANVNDMANSCASAVNWVSDNITRYSGSPDRIYVSGHSAGGHLAALISLRNEYFDSLKMSNPIKGAILIDAAGLDMFGYLKKENLPKSHHYLKVFGDEPAVWKSATPLYYLKGIMPRFLIYQGEKTYPSIKDSNQKFVKELGKYVEPQFKILKGKKHVPMITQFFNSKNPLYNEIINFMQ
ncbi:MAG TPA: alpha/beta hydrolase [Cytophagaceae bacterium]|jgi:hypothetical protein